MWVDFSMKRPLRSQRCMVQNVKHGPDTYFAMYDKPTGMFFLDEPTTAFKPALIVTHFFPLPEPLRESKDGWK